MGKLEESIKSIFKIYMGIFGSLLQRVFKKSGDPMNADIDADSFKEWVYGKWTIAPEHKMKQFGHPAMFPEELADRVLKLFSFKGDVILDPFAGVGTTCLSARINQRPYIG